MRLPFCILNVLGGRSMMENCNSLRRRELSKPQEAGSRHSQSPAPVSMLFTMGKRGNNYPFHAGHNQDHLMDSVFRDRLAIQLEK
jgi:hypothetical protein